LEDNSVNFIGEKTSGKNFNKLVEMNLEDHTNLYRISETFNIGDDFQSISVTDTNTTILPKTIYILRHNQRHFPINPNAQSNWSIVQIEHDVMNNTKFDKLKNGHYMFCVGIDGNMDNIVFTKKYI
jgi:hypothetical protein